MLSTLLLADAVTKEDWITVNGQHVMVNGKGEPIAGNPKVTGDKGRSKEYKAAGKAARIAEQKANSSRTKQDHEAAAKAHEQAAKKSDTAAVREHHLSAAKTHKALASYAKD